MGRTLKKIISLLLAVTLLLSLGGSALAAGDNETEVVSLDDGVDVVSLDDAAEPVDPDDGGVILETKPLDPAQLGVPRLGETGLTAEEIDSVELEDPDTPVRVSVFLSQPSALDAGYPMTGVGLNSTAIAYRSDLLSQQRAVTTAIESATGHSLNVKWNLTLAANAISAWVRAGDIKVIERVPGVRSVVRERQYEPQTDDASAEPNTANTSQYMVGATAAWANGYTGAGSRIAIIDTGLDTTHQSFNADAFNHAIEAVRATGRTVELMTSADVSAVRSQLNSKTANYVSAKIPYGYNYVDGNTTVTHMRDTEGEHGSHVAGIAAANRYIKNGSGFDDAASSVHAVGMAPDAQLLVMKVFGQGGGAYDSDYMAAIEDAVVLGCDSVNLSLGSGSQGFTFAGGYQDIMNALADRMQNEKMVVTISAGNSSAITENLQTNLYADDVSMHTGGSPGTFVNSLCVASADNVGNTGAPLLFGDCQVFYTDTLGSMTSIPGTYNFVYIDALGEAADYSAVNSAVNLSGKVVIVNRGGISFVEKGNNAVDYRPKALIVANNQPGTISMGLDDYTGSFPVVSITLADANAIKASSVSHTAGGYTYYTGSMTVTDSVVSGQSGGREDAQISDFSSWGVPGSLLMKPEIAAPGGDIYSVYGTNKTNSGTAGGSDQYELMSGTSMAAPHMAGLAGVMAQYLRENDLSAVNSALTSAYSTRAVSQSLLMSTATPMKPYGSYLSVLQQGAGLADVNAATSASSVVMMSSADGTLTARTGAAADGKVKAELGDDPDRTGSYSYSFSLYNLTGNDLEYQLSTDLFTQAEEDGFMLWGTAPVAASVSYSWTAGAAAGHDVDKNGVTDDADAQAILDYVSGKNSGAGLDLAAADMDGDNAVTSRDAHLLLNYEQQAPSGGYVLPANGKADVTVYITLTDKASLEAAFPSGAYIEGFTYARCITTTSEGVSLEHQHSIPVLGFYGSWTDPSMFDNNSYVEDLYGSEKIPYTGHVKTNYLTLQQKGSTVEFSGNPYMVEPEFPADRLAMNSSTRISRIYYNLIRAAGTTGYAATALDEDGNVVDVLGGTVNGNDVDGIWYYQSQGAWQNLGTRNYSVNKSPADYGLAEGDRFRVGFYAIPEYYGMLVNDDYTSASAGMLDPAGFQELLTSNELGRGAFVGYDFIVDDSAPVIGQATLNGSQLTVSAADNLNLAYVAVLSLDGTVKYAEKAPGEATYSITIDASDAIANAPGYVAVFAGDYAGNETALAVKVNDNISQDRTVYKRTDTLAAGKDYLIVSTGSVGSGKALGHSGTTVAVNAVTVRAADEVIDAPYIDSRDVAETSVWSSSSGYKLKNGNYYLMLDRTYNALSLSTSSATNASWTWDGTNNRLYITSGSRSYYLRYYNDYFSLNTAVNSVYLYEKTVVRVEVDPYEASEIQLLSESSLDLYKGNTADLSVEVLPLTAEDRTVDWSSSNTSVATVDQGGRVTAVGAGSAVITAAAHSNPDLTAKCNVNVISINKNLNSIIWDEEGGVYFSRFNANSLPTWNKLHDDAKGQQLASAFMQSSSNLYAATLDASSAETVLYTVNRSSYAMTEYGVNYLWATDMAIAATTYASYVGMAYTFGTYLVAGPIAPGDDGEGGTYCGLPYAADDFSETTGGAYFAGIACKSRSSAGGTFFVLDENGIIWETTLYYSDDDSDNDGEADGFVFSELELVVDTGIGTSFLYQNLYYDGEGDWLYWGHTADNIAELIIIDPDSGAIYHAGNFGEGVWPATGMYVDGSVAPAGTGDETMGAELPADLTPVATRAELMTEEVMARFTAEAARFGVTGDSGEFAAEPDQDSNETETVELEEEPAVYELPVEDLEEPVVDLLPVEPELPGEYDSVPGTPDGARFRRSSLRGAEAGAPQGETVTITLSEDEDAANGVIELVFDPQYLTFVSAETADSEVYYSCNSAQSGLVRIAYARKSAGAVSFSVAFTDLCDDSGLTVATTQRDTNLALEETEELCRVVVTDHNTGAAETLSGKAFYTVGETVAFTVSADKACLAAVRAADGSYTVLTSADPGTGSYSFTVEGKCAVELVYKGDVNADGRISAVDAILAKRAAVGRFTPEGLALAAGDLNGDGSLTTADAFLIARAAIRLQTIDW